MTMKHLPVMVDEVLQFLAVRPGGVYVDATLGTGGHAEAILKASAPSGKVIGLDWDAAALAAAAERLGRYGERLVTVRTNFANLASALHLRQTAKVDGILADFGMSSVQVDTAARGFSFARRGPLDMRMDQTQSTTAAALVNEAGEQELATWFHRYGEERFAKRVARGIVTRRRAQPFSDTIDFAEVVRRAIPAKYCRGRIDPSTRVFQALRIVVNGELLNVERLLGVAPLMLAANGRLVLVSYHSLEDRIVKDRFREWAGRNEVRLLTKKPVVPTAGEIRKNPRARSAKLRALERL